MSHDTDFSFYASPMMMSCTDGPDGWSVSTIPPDDLGPDRQLLLGILSVMQISQSSGSTIHHVRGPPADGSHGMATDSTFSGLVFPEHSDPVQVDDAFLGEPYGITVQSGRSVPYGLTVEDYHETPWFRDSVDYILMYDHRDRYIMTDRDPKSLGLISRVFSSPAEPLTSMMDSNHVDDRIRPSRFRINVHNTRSENRCVCDLKKSSTGLKGTAVRNFDN